MFKSNEISKLREEGWSSERLVDNPKFMRNQRNRMMYKTMVLERTKFVGLEEYLTKAKPSDEDNYYTRGLTFILDLMFSNENTGEIECDYMFNGEKITIRTLIGDKELAYRLLRIKLGIEAFTTMILKEQYFRADHVKFFGTDKHGRDQYTILPWRYSGHFQAEYLLRDIEKRISCEQEFIDEAKRYIKSVEEVHPDGFRFNALLEPKGEVINVALNYLQKLKYREKDAINEKSLREEVYNIMYKVKYMLEEVEFKIPTTVDDIDKVLTCDKKDISLIVYKMKNEIMLDEDIRKHLVEYKVRETRFNYN